MPHGKATRTASMTALDDVRVLGIDAAFNERLEAPDKANWFLTFAIVVNEKLEQATHERADLKRQIENRDSLIARFADPEPIGVVKAALAFSAPPARQRYAIVWFSDIARFSQWSEGQDAPEVARLAKLLLGAQLDVIRSHGGTIDKFMGDGLMAFWFADTEARRKSAPLETITCARTAADAVNDILNAEGLQDTLGIRIGMHSGPVAFGDFGAGDRIAVTILGKTVNLASRYEQAREPELGLIRISPELRAMAIDAGADMSQVAGPVTVQVKKDRFDIYSL